MKIDKEITLEQLTPLQDFTDYYINLNNGDVYGYKVRGRDKSKMLRKHNGQLTGRNNRNQQRYYVLTDKDGRKRRVSQGRLMISASRGISYYIIPKDISCNYKDGEIVMRSRSEAAIETWRDRLFEQNKTRINDIRHDISCLMLLEKAFLGDCKPLFDYIHGRTDCYMKVLKGKMHWGNERAYAAVQTAADYLYEVVKGEHCSHIYALDRWFVETAICLWRNDEAIRKRTYCFSKEELQYRATKNKDNYEGA